MEPEIERKFLTASEDWKDRITGQVRLRDGLIAAVNGRKMRVRIADSQALLTIKGKRDGLTRDEFEYSIPLGDAERLLDLHCDGNIVTKTRHFVEEDGHLFEVDVSEGALAGVVIVEIELTDPEATFPRPSWLGEEITGREEYRKINLLRERTRQRD